MSLRFHAVLAIFIGTGMTSQAVGAQSIILSSAPATLVVREAVPGSELEAAVDVTTSFDLVTTAPGQRIVARLEEPLPRGLTLTIEVVAPAGAASAGRVQLGMLDREIVGAIPTPGSYTGLSITYRLTALTTAGTVPRSVGRVLFSVLDPANRTVMPR